VITCHVCDKLVGDYERCDDCYQQTGVECLHPADEQGRRQCQSCREVWGPIPEPPADGVDLWAEAAKPFAENH
jgi:hypothetical protein